MCRVLNEDGWKIMDDGDFLFCLQISFSVSPTPTLRPLGYLNTHTDTILTCFYLQAYKQLLPFKAFQWPLGTFY